jgi:hypothetical protein
MKPFEKLRLKLNKELGLNIPHDAIFKRTYAGPWQLSAGVWKWCCHYPSNPYDIGSCFTAKEILNAKKLSMMDREIFVEDDDEEIIKVENKEMKKYANRN